MKYIIKIKVILFITFVFVSCNKKDTRVVDENGTVFFNLDILDSNTRVSNISSFQLDTFNLLNQEDEYNLSSFFTSSSNPDSVEITYWATFLNGFVGLNTSSEPILFRFLFHRRVSKSSIDTTQYNFKFKDDQVFYNQFKIGGLNFYFPNNKPDDISLQLIYTNPKNNSSFATIKPADNSSHINNFNFTITNTYLDDKSKSIYLNIEILAPWKNIEPNTTDTLTKTIIGTARIKLSNKITM